MVGVDGGGFLNVGGRVRTSYEGLDEFMTLKTSWSGPMDQPSSPRRLMSLRDEAVLTVEEQVRSVAPQLLVATHDVGGSMALRGS